MKVVGMLADKLVLDLDAHERRALLRLLKLYPRVPPAHHRLTKGAPRPSGPYDEANQRLLEEAMAEQRAEHKRSLRAFVNAHLAPPASPLNEGCRLTLSGVDMEFLLQVLNDIRVGSWILLGSPEARVQLNSPDAWAMELAGFFQSELLSALDQGPRP